MNDSLSDITAKPRQVGLPGGWLVATNLNNILKKPSPRDAAVPFQTQTIVRLAAEVDGLTFGEDVVVEL